MALRDLLAEAQGKSEFVITVVSGCARLFHLQANNNESTDIGMFIRDFTRGSWTTTLRSRLFQDKG
jgi:hypothetical protein